MTAMEDDGPTPMRNMKPAKKQRTGADKFYSDHQMEYHDRDRQKDRSNRVRMHNNAYPKLIDELEKRRSVAQKVRTSVHVFCGAWQTYTSSFRVTARVQGMRPCACVLRDMYARQTVKRGRCIDSGVARPAKSVNRRTPRSRLQLCNKCLRTSGQKTRRNRYQRQNYRRITKARRAPRRYRKPSKITMSRGCQYFYRAPIETKSVSTYDDDSVESENIAGSSRNCETTKSLEKDVNEALAGKRSSLAGSCEKRKSETSHKFHIPVTSPPSLSSYNSFASMDHEPMVD